MTFLLVMKALWDRRELLLLAVIAALVFWVRRERAELSAMAVQLAAKPRVETKIRVETKTVVVQGPVRVVEKLVAGQVIERTTYRDAETTTTGTDKESDKTPLECPVQAAATRTADRYEMPWRYAGVIVDPTAPSKLAGLRAGVTLWNRLDVGLATRVSPRREGQAELSVRF